MTDEGWTLSLDALIEELKTVRLHGASKLRGLELPELTHAAQIVDPERPIISEMLQMVLETFVGMTHEAVGYTFGLIGGTELLTSKVRRERTAEILDLSEYRTRRSREIEILNLTAGRIDRLVYHSRKAQESGYKEDAIVATDELSGESLTRPEREEKSREFRPTKSWWIAAFIVIPLVTSFIPDARATVFDWAKGLLGSGTTTADTTHSSSTSSTVPTSQSTMVDGSRNISVDNDAWEPEREMYTMITPAPTPAFNSIRNSPTSGDERTFVDIRHKETAQPLWYNAVSVKPGDVLSLRVFFENSCADNLQDSDIHNARMRIKITKNSSGKEIQITGYLSGSNVTTVLDKVKIYSKVPVDVSPETDDARIYTPTSGDDGIAISDSLLNESGMAIGGDKFTGTLKPGYEYSGYLLMYLYVTQG